MNNDHGIGKQPLAQRAYEIFAPEFILTRLLAQYHEIGLTDEQIRRLLDIKRSYRRFLLRHWPKLISNWTRLDRLMNRHSIPVTACRTLIRHRAKLIAVADDYFLTTSVQIQEVLTSQQERRLQRAYAAEKEEYLRRIAAALRHKLSPVQDLFRK